MRQVDLLGLLAILVTSFSSIPAYAQEPNDDDDDAQQETEEPKQAKELAEKAPADAAKEAKPAVETPAPVPAAEAPPPKPKFGDTTVTGYLRGGFGASSQKGRMTCFSLALPGALVSKYRLGNECEIWSETHFTTVVYAGDDGSVAHVHFMPTIFIPTTTIGYSPNGTTSSPAPFTTSTGATISFPNLYVDMERIPWLAGGTVWAGNRYYKRESVYISDFFYWNPSGVGVGIEDIHLGKDLRLSYGAFAVDGEPVPATSPAPSLPPQSNFGVRNDLQLRGIKPYASGEFQVGFQYIANYSNDPNTHSGWGVTLQHVQQMLGGNNKLALQYGRGGGTGFGTLARFYYPDFSVRHDMKEWRARLVDVVTIQPTAWFGAQATFVYQHDDLGSTDPAGNPTTGGITDWFSAGTRMGWAFTEHAKLLGEVGFDQVKKDNGADAQWLAKFTFAPAITMGREFMNRPELRFFYTWAMWNEAARTASVDSGRIYTATDKLSGAIFGVQAETWW